MKEKSETGTGVYLSHGIATGGFCGPLTTNDLGGEAGGRDSMDDVTGINDGFDAIMIYLLIKAVMMMMMMMMMILNKWRQLFKMATIGSDVAPDQEPTSLLQQEVA